MFVEISINVEHLVRTVNLNLRTPKSSINDIVLAGTIQFSSAIRAAKPELQTLGFKVVIPQSKPLSAGEILGCTAPKIGKSEGESVVVFVADGRFHLEAFMIANPGIKAFRYDPYMGKLFLEEYDHVGMRESRKRAVLKAKGSKTWGIILGTLGRQGNPKSLERLEKKMRSKGFGYTVVLMSEISPQRIALFEDSVEAWIQIACPRLSIDWGDAFGKPVLTPFEAEIALGDLDGWWERNNCDSGGCGCACNESSCGERDRNGNPKGIIGDYPMDYYAQDGGKWNSSHMNKPSRPVRRY